MIHRKSINEYENGVLTSRKTQTNQIDGTSGQPEKMKKDGTRYTNL